MGLSHRHGPGELGAGDGIGIHVAEGNVRRPWATWGREVKVSDDPRLAGLTGRPDRPAPPLPAGLVPGLHRLADVIGDWSDDLGGRVTVDPVAAVTDRAAASGLIRRGEISCNGSCHLLASAGGWVAVNLPRPVDWELTAAWLELDAPVGAGRWDQVAAGVSGRSGVELVERAALVGLAVAVVGERAGTRSGHDPTDAGPPGVVIRDCGADSNAKRAGEITVVDLSSLWAGPLAGSLLVRAGARVVKVDSTSRPDGARRGPAVHFGALNHEKEEVGLDFASACGRQALTDLISRADVVISSCRPRALDQLGLDPATAVGEGGPSVWLTITGYGDDPGSAERVAFGDDAAAAGGLVVWDDGGPCFCGDAVADPATGLAGAAGVFGVLRSGRRAVVSASLADVAGGLA